MNILILDLRKVLADDNWFMTMYRKSLIQAIVFNKYHEFIVKCKGCWYEHTEANGWVMTVRPTEGFIEKYSGKNIIDSGFIKATNEITNY